MSGPRVLSSLLLAGVLLGTTSARADMPRTMRLEVERAAGAAGCPTAEAVRDAIAATAGVDPIDEHAGARLVVTLAAGAGVAEGHWQLFGADGARLRERSMTVAGSCQQLVGELAVAFAVAWETGATKPCTCDDACMAKAREQARRELIQQGYGRRMADINVAVLAGALLSANFTADPGPGLFLSGELHGEVLSGALEARVLFPSRVVAEPTKFEYDYTAVTAALVPCARWKVLLGCAVFDIGMLIAGGDVSFADSSVIATMGIGPRLAVHVPFGERFAVRAFADLRIAPVPSVSTFIDTGAKWESQVVSGLFGVGLGFE